MTKICAAAMTVVGMTAAAQAMEPVTPQPASPLTYSDPAYAKVVPAEAKKMLEAGVVMIDVREPDEFAEGHVPGSINVPLSSFKFGMRLSAVPNLDDKVLVICRSGVRAERASRVLVESGYRHVYNAYGTSQWPYGLVR
ncbi:rhodanese-like domain-containing protein [Sutterella sp.]|uniref:rhodanese-like domain-containing protein n=1 Tax=Sutterella sp. TaxID=1981025 RepID=UPI0026E0FEFF|nr:rhodanese-like domain-containing protein [Sutterella sp.]MDO5530924.1 rhodanese-like domain-containing protein [Sutterella sp.]